jgi:hypothetical protein
LGATLAADEPQSFPVRHRHVRNGAEATLRISDDGISFEETGKPKTHSRQWRFEDIEQLTLGPAVLRILTYEDKRWLPGRDRVFVFDYLPKDLAAHLYPTFSRRLDQRFVAALADEQVRPLWELPVKLLHRRLGSQGVLIVGSDRVVYRTSSAEESRTWRMIDIDAVSSSGPFDLTMTSFERSGANYAGRKDFHFELKRALTELEFNSLWRQVNQTKGLKILNSSAISRQQQ